MWLLACWSFLFLCLYVLRHKLYYPEDHPFYTYRRLLVSVCQIALLVLIGTHLYVQYYVNQVHDSEIRKVIDKSEQGEGLVHLSGRIDSHLDFDGDRVRFTLEVESFNQQALRNKEKLLLTRYVKDLDEQQKFREVSRRDGWEGFVKVSSPHPAKNPGAFNYKEYLYQQGIHFTGIIEGEWSYQPTPDRSAKLLGHLDQQRNQWIEQIDQIFSADMAPIVQAMTIGARDQLNPETVEQYQLLGLIHVLAISGLHVGIILWSLYFLLLQLPITKERALTILLIFIPIYMYLSGAQVSVLRAGLMGMIALLCIRFNLWKQSILAFYLVYIVLLLWNPFYLFQVGFQLSFAITYFLLVGYKPMKRFFSFLPERIGGAIGIALLAQIISIPIILQHFYQFSPFSFILNLLLVPIYSLIYIPGAFILTLLSLISIEAVQLGVYLYEYTLQALHHGYKRILELPYSTIHTGPPAFWWLLLYGSTFLFSLVQMERGRRISSWVCLGALPIYLALLVGLPYLDKEATITMLDVGQGEAIVIELPFREEVVVIDLGGQVSFPKEDWKVRKKEYEVGRDAILPYLRYRGINKIDTIVISHGHYDHFAGIQGLLGKIHIGRILRSPIPPQSEFEREWLMKLLQEEIPIYGVTQGLEWKTENTTFHVVYPHTMEKDAEKIENIHRYNVVLWNQIYDTTFIWTGDVEKEGEAIIMERYPRLQADFLKVAHHGSLTSTSDDWVEQLRPRYALISAGLNNRYKLPNNQIIDKLAQHNITIFRTDYHGGIVIKVLPDKVRIIPSLHPTGK